MKTYRNLYNKIISPKNLFLAWKKARKDKTKKPDVIKFEKYLGANLKGLHKELKEKSYKPLPLVNFPIRDPKTRKISKSDFRDRIVHHAIVRVIEPIFDKGFVNDSCANRVNKGTLYAVKRFEKFQRKVTENFRKEAFCLKADIKHYFQEVNHDILQKILERKVKDDEVLHLISIIMKNSVFGGGANARKECLLAI